MQESSRQKKIVEALIVAAPSPISAARLSEIVPRLTPAGARDLVAELSNEYDDAGRGIEIWEVAGGYQLRTRQEFAPYVRQLHKERTLRLSRAALETLSIVAYKQPVTRAEIEEVRGVDAGPMLRSLVDRELVRVAGHKEVLGRPLLYATTKRFLEVFGLTRLDDLPTLRDIDELLPAPGERADGGEDGEGGEGGENGAPYGADASSDAATLEAGEEDDFDEEDDDFDEGAGEDDDAAVDEAGEEDEFDKDEDDDVEGAVDDVGEEDDFEEEDEAVGDAGEDDDFDDEDAADVADEDGEEDDFDNDAADDDAAADEVSDDDFDDEDAADAPDDVGEDDDFDDGADAADEAGEEADAGEAGDDDFDDDAGDDTDDEPGGAPPGASR